MTPDLRPIVDDAIDRVARDMTSGAPSADFRRGVISRLESRQPTRFAWPTFAAGMAAAAVVALAGFVMWPRGDHAAPSTITMTTPAPIFVPPASPLASPDVAFTPAAAPPGASSRPSFESAIRGLPPIERPDPITQESIQPERLSIPQLRIEAIVMPPVDDGSGQE